MSRAASAIRHSALEPAAGRTVAAAEISDRARLAVALQGAGLLSLCEVAGWRLAAGWRGAQVDEKGRLNGLVAEPGRSADGAAPALVELLGMLFRADAGTIAGRGEARRAARELLERWVAALDRLPADRAVDDLLAAAPFLAASEVALAGLAGALVRDGVEVPWRAGRSGCAACAADPRELAERGRWALAARGFGAAPPADAAGRLLWARALYGAGRAEAALAVLEDRDDVAAEILRAECRLTLGEIGVAREAIRRLEARALTPAELVAGGDVALRVLALSGEPERARDWSARALARSRGADRTAALLLAALAACDRRDLDAMERLLGEAAATPGAAARSSQLDEVRLQLALAWEDGAAAVGHASARLRTGRRRMARVEAGRTWNNLGVGRLALRRFAEAERAFGHAARLLRGCDGPLALTLAAANLAETRLRVGKLAGVEPILEATTTWNRRSANRRGAIEDGLIGVRLELVRFDLERALERVAALAGELAAAEEPWAAERLAVLEARALGWLGRAAAARAALTRSSAAALLDLEPEELPFLFALAGDTDRAVDAAERSPWTALAVPLVRGEVPKRIRWRALDELEPFRRARFVLDAEQVAPGAAPAERREEAAALFRRLGAASAAERVERSRAVGWRALAEYFERPAGDRAAIERLFAAVGHPEAELALRGRDGERLLAGRGGRPFEAERSAVLGESELVLRAAEFDAPLRALFALFLREVLPTSAEEPAAGNGGMVGESSELLAAIRRLRRLAASELPVLILGENGTGKELAAHEVHRASGRSGPLVPLNCAGLSESLLLSELFGHARGAFTGAERERAGIFESARGGTAFLDEVGDLPAAAQGTLLRVLQEKEVRRLGESLARRVDVRVVAATNRNLEAMVEEGRFRQDLYFRLKAATVVLPPLRDRGRDTLLLADHFVAQFRRRRPELKLAAEARRTLAAHSWPGNVRELRNVLEAAAALSEDGRIASDLLDLGSAPPPARGTRPGDYHVELEAFRRRLIETALAACGGNLAAAARKLGTSRQHLSQFVRRHGLKV